MTRPNHPAPPQKSNGRPLNNKDYSLWWNVITHVPCVKLMKKTKGPTIRLLRGGGGWFGLVVKFFFNTLIHNEIFFSSMRLQIIFFALQHSAGIFFFCVDGVEKVGIPLLLLATLAAVLFNSNTEYATYRHSSPGIMQDACHMDLQ